MNIDTTFVTFFYDIGREGWSGYSRKTEDYIKSFKALADLNYKMVIYIDERYFEDVKSILDKSEFSSNKKLISVNDDWLNNNIWSWDKILREKDIMNSDYYKSLVSNRIILKIPENVNPRYTILTHSKIDIVAHAIDNGEIDTEHVAWIDFGYYYKFNDESYKPNGELNDNLLDLSKMNLCAVMPIDDRDRDMIYNLQVSPEKLGAYFFFANKENHKKFQRLCHKWLLKYQEMGIADDEQSLWLQCYFEDKDLFKIHSFYKWHMAMSEFTK